MNNQTDIGLRFTNKVQGSNLTKYAETLERIQKVMKSLPKDVQLKAPVTGDYSKQLDTIISKMGNLKDKAKDTKSALSGLGTGLRIGALITSLKRLGSTLGYLTDKSSDYLESINLYQVAFNGATEEADKFVSTLSEMYGLDEAWLIKTIGLFKQLTNAMGLTEKQGTRVSMLLTQMSIDITSLYNSQPNRASQVLQSAMASQTRPVRGLTGADITMSTLQTTLDNLGIDRAVSQLSFAEKRLVIIISLTQQLNRVANDWGKTLESPANQTRILSEQWARLTRAVGNVFLPIIAKVLPYLNAVLMVLTEIISAIATLFGYKEEDYDFGVGIADEILDIEEALDGANESAKALKQGLRGFDRLNVITTPSRDSGSTGAGLGVSSDIWGAFDKAYTEYMDKLEKVKMKATEIRNLIMEWLGFTELTDEEGNHLGFTFEKITSGTVLGALAVGGAIFVGIMTIIRTLSKINSFLGISEVFNGISTALQGTLGTVITVVGAIVILGLAIYDLYQKNEEFARSFDEKWAGIKEALEPIKEMLMELFDTLKRTFTETIIPMGEQIWEIIQTTASTLLDILYPVFVDVILPVINLLLEIINDVFETINELWKEYGEPISNEIQKAITSIGELFNELWTQFLKPIVEKIIDIATDLWENTLRPMFHKIGQVIGEVIELVLVLWNNVLAPVVKYLIDTLAPVFETVFSFVADVFGTAFKFIGGIINGFLDILRGIIKFLTGIFSGDFSKALEGIKDIFKGIINGIITIAEGMVNGVISLLNLGINGIWNGIKSLANKITGVISGIAKALGFNVDLTLKGTAPQIGLISIPRLKAGIDFVPNDYFPAYLDYGERVLTKEENQDYTAFKNGEFDNVGKTSFNPTFIIQVGNEQLGNYVIKDLEGKAKANGKPFTIGG